MSNNNTSIADYQKSFAAMLAGAAANAPDLIGTEAFQAGLADSVAQINEAQARKNHFKFQAQQATRDLEDAMARAKENYSRLRAGIVMHYTATSEQLVEFGLQPRRAAVRTKAKPTTPEDRKPLPNPAFHPVQTAAAETDGAIGEEVAKAA